MKKYKVVVLIECGKEQFFEEIEVEAEEPSPGATTAAFKEAYKRHQGRGYRFSFGGVYELESDSENNEQG